jgi:serine/threonine-protein kinase
VTTATDVHALGILLYQLLAGHNPFTHTPLPADELARAILEQTPPPPSQVVAGPVPGRALRGDLDNITSMALRKDPARRYASAEWLAADVQRYLRHEPVSARSDSLAYRAGKFVRRHRLMVAVAAAFILSLGAFSIVTARQAMLVARERDVAAAERDKARAVSDFLTDLFEVDPLADDESVSDTMPLREFLTRSEDKVRRELADRPEVKATLLRQLTRLYGNLGRLDHARELGEEALALRTSMGDTGSAELATTLTVVATVQQEQGEYEVAEKNFRRVLAIREAIHNHQPANAEVAEAVNNLAVVLAKTRRPENAAEDEALTRRALALRTQIFGADHADTAQSLNNLAVFLYWRRGPGDLEEAEKLYRQAIAIRVRRLGARHPSVAITQNNYANVLRELGRHEEAEAMFRTAIDSLTAALGPEHPWLSNMLVGLHKVLAARGDFAGAEAALRHAMAIADKTLPPDHPARKDGQSALDDLLRRAGKTPSATGP